jgi:acyl-CoA thioesterase FadM
VLSRDDILQAPPVFTHPTHVRFADSVGGGRLFHPKMLELLHDAYEALLADGGAPLDRVLRERAWGAPLAHADVELLGDPRFGTALDVGVTAAEVRKNRVTFGYCVRDRASGEAVAIGRTVHAFIDLATFQKIELPDAVRAIVARFPERAGGDGPSARRDDLLAAPARFTHRIRVGFEDVDAAGFVFFARTTAFFHRAYCELRRQASLPIAEYGPKATSRVVSTEADFLKPLRAGDEADVLVVSSAFEGGVATLGFRIVTPQNEPVAVGTLAHTATGPVVLPG